MVSNIYKHNYKADKTAVIFKGENITYSQLDAKVGGYAACLRKHGLQKGDKVVLSCINSPEFIYSYFGTVRSGAVIVPINLLLTVEEIIFIVKDSGAKFMIVHPVILEKGNLTPQALESVLGIKILVLDAEFMAEADKLSGDPQAVAAVREDHAEESDVSTFLYTSGTTGKPKAAMLTNKNLVLNSEQCFIALEALETDIYLCVLPMFHVFAFTACILLPLYSGATVVIMESFQPKEVIENLVKHDITTFMGVPAMYTVLLDAGKRNIHFPKLRLAISGGAALPVEIYRQAREILGMPAIEGYGLTEASPAVAFNPPSGIQKEASIGLQLPYVDCIIGDENDKELPPGEIGELLVRGENVMLGYYGQPEATAETLRNGWLHTGDMAKRDEEGYIYIVDRKKDMVIVSGLNVYSREVEEVIYKHPKVKETAVIGIPDKLRGEYVKAFVVLKDGEEDCHSKEILRFLRDHLAAYKLPRRIQFVDHLPKNASGKIMKKMLREQYADEEE